MKSKLWIILLINLLFLTGCEKGSQNAKPAEDNPESKAEFSDKEAAAEKETDSGNSEIVPLPPVTILADGIIQAVQPVLPVAFETSGKLLSVNVQVGDEIAAGTLIAILDDTSLQDTVVQAQLQVEQAENNLTQAEQALTNLEIDRPLRQAEAQQALAAAQENVEFTAAQLEGLDATISEATITTAQARVTLTAKELERTETNYAPYRAKPDDNVQKAQFGSAWAQAQLNYDAAVRQLNNLTGAASNLTRAQKEANLAVAQEQLTKAQANLDKLLAGNLDETAQLNIAQAEISLEQSQLNLTQAEEALSKSHLLSPWTGTIISVAVVPGAPVGAGTPIITILDTTHLEFHTTNLSERDLGQVFPGQAALITLKAFPNEPLDATVVRIGWQAGAPVGDAATFPVALVLNETDLTIRPGMTGRVEIHAGDE
jgi:multidrug efflux pump subunit AcrA (membrane-fusion protein)